MDILQNTENRVMRSSNPRPGPIPEQNCNSRRYMFPYVPGSTIHNSQDIQFSSVQSLSHVRLFAHQASLSITNSRSSLKLTSIESVMPSSHLILSFPFSSCPQSLPASGSFPMSQLFARGGQSIGVSASASVLPMNTQDLL